MATECAPVESCCSIGGTNGMTDQFVSFVEDTEENESCVSSRLPVYLSGYHSSFVVAALTILSTS